MSSMTPVVALPESSMFAVKSFLYGAVGFQIYEWYCDLAFQFTHIASLPPSSMVKWRYLWSRYMGMFVQTIYTVFSAGILSFDSVPFLWCRIFHVFTGVMFETLFLSTTFTLRDRMLPLYSDRPRTAFFLKALVVIEAIACFAWTIVITQRLHLAGACVIMNVPSDTIYFSAMRLAFQATFWVFGCLTFETTRPTVWRIVVQDVSSGFGTIFVLFISLLTGSRLSNLDHVDISHFYQLLFPLAVVVTASINCHLIRKAESALPPVSDEDRDALSEIELNRLVNTPRYIEIAQ